MPITPSYSWTETNTHVVLTVEIKNVNSAKLDADVTDLAFKLNYNPYILIIDFAHEIDHNYVSAAVTNDAVLFTFTKLNAIMWGALQPALSKSEAIARRAAAADRKTVADAAEREKRQKTKDDVKKHALHTQWAVEHTYKDMMESIQQQDKQEAEQDLQEWLDHTKNPKSIESKSEASVEHKETHKKKGIVWSDQLESHRTFDHKLAPHTHRASLKDPANKLAGPKHSILKDSPISSPVLRPQPAPAVFHSNGVTIEELDDEEAEAKKLAAKKRQQQAEMAKNIAEIEKENPVEFDPRVPRSEYLSQEQLMQKLRDQINSDQNKTIDQNTVAESKDIFTEADVDPSSAAASIPIRSNSKVEIGFTKTTRGGPGPARNSRFGADVPQTPSKSGADVQDGEQQAVFLKDKGDNLFRQNDLHGAVGAYTAALNIDASNVPIRSNRAACYLRLVDSVQLPHESDSAAVWPAMNDVARVRVWLNACVADCDAALQTLFDREAKAKKAAVDACVPCEWTLTPEEAKMRAKLMLRRGLARHGCGDVAGATYDLSSASALQSDLSADAERVSALNEEYKLDRHQTLKKQGDALYQQRKFEDACLLYSRALVICNPFITCLSNRAAANLVRQRFAACVYDCTLALSHMENIKNKSDSSDKAPSSSIGACLEQQLTEAESKKLRVRLLSRRGAANIGLDNLIAAKQDYSLAVAADPHDLSLIQDLQRINQRIREMNENIKSDESAASAVAPVTTAVTSDEETKNEVSNEQSTSVNAQPPTPSPEPVSVPAVNPVTPVVAESSNAAALFQSGKFAQALELFSAQVRAAPSNANLLLNRAACHLALKDCVGCIADCNRALELLSAPVDTEHQTELDMRASLECVALTRRAAASCWLGDAALAVEDLRAIVALSSSHPRCLTAAELQCTVHDLQHAEKLAAVQVK